MPQKNQLHILNTVKVVEGITSSLIGIFAPIYFLTIGFSLRQIFVYYLIYSTGIIFFFVLAAKLCEYFGIKKTFLIRIPFLFIYISFMLWVKNLPLLFYVIPVLDSLDAGLFWYPVHIILTTYAPNKELGKRVASFIAWPKAVGIILPIISGSIAVLYGFKILFMMALVVYLFSSILYLQFEEIKIKTEINLKKIYLFFKKYPRYIAIEVIENFREDITGIIWPIFVFISLAALGGSVGEKIGIFSVGTINTISAIIGLMFTVVAGRLADKKDRKKILNYGFLIVSLIWLLAYKIDPGPFNLYFISLLLGLSAVFIEVPYQAFAYSLAQNDYKEEFIVFREMPLFLGRALVYTLCIAFAAFLKTAFIFSSIIFLLFVLI